MSGLAEGSGTVTVDVHIWRAMHAILVNFLCEQGDEIGGITVTEEMIEPTGKFNIKAQDVEHNGDRATRLSLVVRSDT